MQQSSCRASRDQQQTAVLLSLWECKDDCEFRYRYLGAHPKDANYRLICMNPCQYILQVVNMYLPSLKARFISYIPFLRLISFHKILIFRALTLHLQSGSPPALASVDDACCEELYNMTRNLSSHPDDILLTSRPRITYTDAWQAILYVLGL